MATRFLKILSNGNKIFKNVVKWQQDFDVQTDNSALLHDIFQFFLSIFYRAPCRLVRATQSAALAIEVSVNDVRKGMVLVDTRAVDVQSTMLFKVKLK